MAMVVGVENAKQDATDERRPKVGVVIGSGGLKSFAAVALLDFLSEAEIDIDLLVGCSGGGIVAALRGAGYDSAQIQSLASELLHRKLFKHVDYRSVAAIARLPFGRFDRSSGILKPDRIQCAYRRIFGDIRLEELRPRTILQATDYQTGEGVVLSTGLVADAVYASGAMYPIIPPICIEGRWLVDGAFSSPVPVIEAVKHNIDIIIVVVFQEKFAQDPQGFMECVWALPKTFTLSLLRSQLPLSIDLHHYEIVFINVPFDEYIQIWDVDKVPTILEAGMGAVEQKKNEILSVIASFQ